MDNCYDFIYMITLVHFIGFVIHIANISFSFDDNFLSRKKNIIRGKQLHYLKL